MPTNLQSNSLRRGTGKRKTLTFMKDSIRLLRVRIRRQELKSGGIALTRSFSRVGPNLSSTLHREFSSQLWDGKCSSFSVQFVSAWCYQGCSRRRMSGIQITRNTLAHKERHSRTHEVIHHRHSSINRIRPLLLEVLMADFRIQLNREAWMITTIPRTILNSKRLLSHQSSSGQTISRMPTYKRITIKPTWVRRQHSPCKITIRMHRVARHPTF